MSFDSVLKNFEKVGNLYDILQIETDANKHQIKKAYKTLAIIYHPDKNKNKDAIDKFRKIKEAYEILSDEILKESYERFLNLKKHQTYKFNENNPERNKFAQDLLKREEEYNKKKDQEAQEKIKKYFEHKAELDKKIELKRKREEEKNELENLNSNKLFDDNEFFKKINSIKIKWQKDSNSSYNEPLIRFIFGEFGLIKECVVFPQKHCAILEYILTSSADKAVQEKQSENRVDDGLKVKYVVKNKKRIEMIQSMKSRKDKKVDFSVNTDTLEKIGSIINRNSNTFISSQMEEYKKKLEREKLISGILDKEFK